MTLSMLPSALLGARPVRPRARLTPAAAWTLRARAASYDVLTVADGRWTHPDEHLWPALNPDAPNDALELARLRVMDSVAWVHAVLPSYDQARRLCLALQPPLEPIPSPIRPRLVQGCVGGREVHAVDIPAALLASTLRGAA
jgi:hypothetical protein